MFDGLESYLLFILIQFSGYVFIISINTLNIHDKIKYRNKMFTPLTLATSNQLCSGYRTTQTAQLLGVSEKAIASEFEANIHT